MTVWVVLSLYLLFFLVSSIPTVQEYAAERASRLLAKKLGTSVSIKRLQFGLLSHITLYGVSIKDQQGKEMLRANRLSARMDLLPLSEGKISISTAQLFGVKATLYQADAQNKPNFQFALDSLASKDTTTTTPINLRINSLIMRQASVSYDRFDKPETPNKLNPMHLAVSDISAHVILKVLTEDSLNINIKRLAFKEKSGLKVNRLSLHFDGGQHIFKLNDFILRMPGTDFQLGSTKAIYTIRKDTLVTSSLTYSGSIKPSTVTLADLSCLLPSLQNFNGKLSVESNFNGRGESLQVPMLKVGSTTGDIGIDIDARADDLLHANPTWAANINDLSLSAQAVSFITENMEGYRGEVPPVLTRLGSIHLKGLLSGVGISDITLNNTLNSDAGHVAINGSIIGMQRFSGNIDTEGIDLKRLLNDDRFGTIDTKITLNGEIPVDKKPLQLQAEGIVHKFDYMGYDYHNISVNGLYSPSDIHGTISIDDSNIELTASGNISRQQKNNVIKLTAHVENFSPANTHLSNKWGDARFSGDISADIHGSDFNNVVGAIDINDFMMRSTEERYFLKSLHLESDYNHDIHNLSLDSDFADIELNGHFNYKTLAQSFTNIIATKLPTLPGLPSVNPNTHNDFAIKATIRKSDWMRNLLQIPIQLSGNMTLHGIVNDDRQQVNINCDIPQFFYNGGRYDNCNISILSPLNTLYYNAKGTKIMDDGKELDLQITGNAFNNQMSTTLTWDDHASDRMSGELQTITNFSSSFDGKEMVNIKVAPSHMTIKNTLWNIDPCLISYTNNRLEINSMSFHHAQQYLHLNGIASTDSQDSISIQMKDVDVEYVLDLTNFHAVDFSGLATGGGSLRGIFGQLEADAALQVKEFKFEHGRMGTLNAAVNWNKENEQIDIHATADDGRDAMTYIDGYVSPKQNYIDLIIKAEGTHLDFAQSFTSSFMSSVLGHAQGAVNLVGPLDAINLTGELVLNGYAHVKTLGCTYELRNDTLRLVPNEITFANFPIYDAHGHRGILTGGIHHQDLTKLTFDIYVDANNLLAYDFRDFGEDTFYGTVFANGQAAIHGRESSVNIEADITPQSGSLFVYNASAQDIITNQEFIEWGISKEATKRSRQQEGNESRPATIVSNEESNPIDEYRSDMNLQLKINATPNATIQLLMDPTTSDYITLKGNGELKANYYNKGGFSLFGTYRVSEGTYGITIQDIIKKNFVFNEGGTIVFGGDPYEAALNLQARYMVNGVSLSDLNVGSSFAKTVRVNCLMNITGQPRAPHLDFDFDMPNVNADEQQMVRSIINNEEEMNQQVIYLLAVGRFYPQQANNATTTEEGQSKTSLAMQSLLSGTLSGQINNMLSRVIKSKNWNFGANISTGDEGWNNAEYEGIINGRLLNNRLLINGQFGYRDKATTATPSFIGDFDISYLLFPNGNLALKVYNQTNDRYFTRSSLNTQGIGIIMKKDFNGLRDLFSTKKKRKKRIK